LDVHVQYNAMRKRGQPDYEEIGRCYVRETPIFAFDECHVLNVSDAMIMQRVMKAMFDEGCCVVATSNLAPKELYTSGINREVFTPFLQQLEQHCEPFDMDRAGAHYDYRQDGAAPRGSRFFHGPASSAALRQAVAEYGESERTELALPLGRRMACTVRPLHGRCLDESFASLCVVGRGVPDYTACLDHVDCVVIRDVPALDAMDEDPARRLVILIDLCYDRKKKVLLSSAHAPEDVFAALREKYSADKTAGSEAVDLPLQPDRGGVPVPTPARSGSGSIDDPSSARSIDECCVPLYAAGTIRSAKVGGASGPLTPLVRALGSGCTAHPENGWVEWSATGLKQASMFDLTVNTDRQLHDRLLPLLRCQSRLKEMARESSAQAADAEARLHDPELSIDLRRWAAE